MKNKLFLIALATISLVFSSCGASEQEIATMTASAWTPTPPPTPTPTLTPTATPIPYALTVKVTDTEGNSIAGASIVLAGYDAPVLTSETGEATLTNLPAPDGSIEIAAPGYFASSQMLNLSRGPNEQAVVLERDPNGLLPSQACAPAETLYYIEDFQSGHALGMDVVEFRAGGWSVGPAPDLPENSVMTLALPDSYGGRVSDNEQASVVDHAFEDAVLRVRLFVTGPGSYLFFWRVVNEPYQTGAGQADLSRYIIFAGTTAGGRGDRTSALVRIQPPLVDFVLANRAVEYLSLNVWHLLEISTYQDNTKVWLDGKEIMDYVDPQPLPAGGFGIAAEQVKAGAIAFYDNMSVCGLNAPFTSMYSTP